MKKTQFSIILANQTGALAHLAEVLAEAEVNMEAISLTDGVHTGVVKLVVDNPEPAREAFKRAELRCHEQQVLAVSLPNKPGALADLCKKLAEDGYSIDYIYGSACRCDGSDCTCKAELMVSVADLEAARVLEGAGFWPRP